MQPATLARSISNESRAAWVAWLMMFRERFYLYGRAYAMDWILRPIFEISIAAMIYFGAGSEKVSYVVVAMAASMIVFSSIYFVGEILDRERVKGTLPSLFLTPCRRTSWMAGYAFAGILETSGRIAMVLVAGYVLFDVRFDPNVPALLAVLPLFILSLSGLALVLSGIGLLIKRANALSNLVSPLLTLLGGVYFPVSTLPDPLRYLARLMPLGYGMDAITAIVLDHASLADVQESLYPLAGFAIVSPIIGLIAFNYLDTLVRSRGEVDIY
ncbi:MAG: ABC transporter permease [Thermomicrobiales bacterium]